MRSPGFLWIIVLLMALLDLYIFQIIRVLTSSQSYRVRVILFSAYWIISVAILLALLFLPNLHYERWSKPFKSYVFALFIGLFFSKLIAAVFFLLDDIRRAMMWLIGKLFSNPSVSITDSTEGINRSVFLSWLGLAAGGSLLGSFIYGFRNKYRYQVPKTKSPAQ